MRRAVAHLQPLLRAEQEKDSVGTNRSATSTTSERHALCKAVVVMATVEGDVYDIRKKVVSAVLACRGYRIVDLGVMVPRSTILQAARAHAADAIALSGLVAPSLDEMTRVAEQMQREGFTLPLLIGGTTTSKLHTAVSIAPRYGHAVVHVVDAAKALDAVAALLDPALRDDFLEGVEEEVGVNCCLVLFFRKTHTHTHTHFYTHTHTHAHSTTVRVHASVIPRQPVEPHVRVAGAGTRAAAAHRLCASAHTATCAGRVSRPGCRWAVSLGARGAVY